MYFTISVNLKFGPIRRLAFGGSGIIRCGLMYISCMKSAGDSLRSVNTSNLFVPRPNSNFMKRALHYSGTILWNALPSIFKQKFSEYLSLQQEHDSIYFSIAYKTSCVSVCV